MKANDCKSAHQKDHSCEKDERLRARCLLRDNFKLVAPKQDADRNDNKKRPDQSGDELRCLQAPKPFLHRAIRTFHLAKGWLNWRCRESLRSGNCECFAAIRPFAGINRIRFKGFGVWPSQPAQMIVPSNRRTRLGAPLGTGLMCDGLIALASEHVHSAGITKTRDRITPRLTSATVRGP